MITRTQIRDQQAAIRTLAQAQHAKVRAAVAGFQRILGEMK